MSGPVLTDEYLMRSVVINILILLGGIGGLYLWLIPDNSQSVAVLDPVRTPGGIETPPLEARTALQFAKSLETMTPAQTQALGVEREEPPKPENELQAKILEIENPVKRTEFIDHFVLHPEESLSEIQAMLKNQSMKKQAIEALLFVVKVQPSVNVLSALEQAAREFEGDESIQAALKDVREPPKSIVEQIADGTLTPEPPRKFKKISVPDRMPASQH